MDDEKALEELSRLIKNNNNPSDDSSIWKDLEGYSGNTIMISPNMLNELLHNPELNSIDFSIGYNDTVTEMNIERTNGDTYIVDSNGILNVEYGIDSDG